MKPVTSTVETQSPAAPNGTRYGLRTPGYLYRSFTTVGNMRMYEINVVEIAMSSTTWNVASAPLLKTEIAVMQKIEATTPERTFTRTGVPKRLLKTPKNGKNAPSYAATA